MDNAALEVQRTMRLAQDWAKEQEGGFFGTALLSPQELGLLKNVHDNEARALRWLGEQRQWAEAGKEPDGRSYPVSFYLSAGKIIANTFAAAVGETAHQNVFSLTVSQSVKDVGTAGTRAVEAVGNVAKGLEDATKAIAKPWPLGVKLLLGAAATAVTVVLGKNLLDKLPNLSGLAGGEK